MAKRLKLALADGRLNYPVCQAVGCGLRAPDGAYGPPLMSRRSRWYCTEHATRAWERWRRRHKSSAPGPEGHVDEDLASKPAEQPSLLSTAGGAST